MYERLGVEPTATITEIKAAFRNKAKLFHPDKTGDSSAEKFQQIQSAYETLADKQSRQVYDQMLIFTKACDFVTNLVIFPEELALTLEQMFDGGTYTCSSGVYDIPPGISAGMIHGKEGSPAPLAPLRIRQVPHTRFTREDDDLHIVIDVGLRDALLGTQLCMQGIDNARVHAVLPASSELPPKPVVVLGAGMIKYQGCGARGSLIIHCHVKLPQELTSCQKNLLHNFF